MHTRGVSATWMRGVMEALAASGLDIDAVCQSAGIDRAAISAGTARCPTEKLSALWDEAARRSRNPAIGLVGSQGNSPAGFDVVGYAMMSSATLLDGLERLRRYLRLVADDHALHIRRVGTSIRLTIEIAGGGRPVPPARYDSIFLTLLNFARWMTGRPLSFGVNLDGNQEDRGKKSVTTSVDMSYRPVDSFALGMEVAYSDREALLVHKGNGRYTSFEGSQWAPKVTMDYFISAKQQLRFSMQWTGLKSQEDRFWKVDANELRNLRPVAKPNLVSDDFIISRMTFQARYRWEIAPLSDLFVVYTRGSNIPGTMYDDYGGLLSEAWSEPIVDTIVVKLRYRLGS